MWTTASDLPSALDNRPLKFEEFENIVNQAIYVSATPAAYEKEKSGGITAQQIIRPTGLLDPEITIVPSEGQIDHLIGEINKTTEKGEKVFVTTLTKKMAESLTDYLKNAGIRVRYLHSEIDTLERMEIIRDLRLDRFDVLVGINLLREGLDIPEVSLVAILDADKEGFLQNRNLTDTDHRQSCKKCRRQSYNVCRRYQQGYGGGYMPKPADVGKYSRNTTKKTVSHRRLSRSR